MYFSTEKKIEFRDIKNLNQTVLKHSVAPCVPDPVCTYSPDTLLYVDIFGEKGKVRWLDCRKSPPVAARGENISQISLDQRSEIWDMCIVGDTRENKLLVIACNYGKLRAFNTKSNELKWKARCKLPDMKLWLFAFSITTDGQGHIFIYDYNNTAVQMFSSGGQYKRAVWQTDEKKFRRIRWHDKSSSLLVADPDGEILFVKIEF